MWSGHMVLFCLCQSKTKEVIADVMFTFYFYIFYFTEQLIFCYIVIGSSQEDVKYTRVQVA